MNTRLHCYSFHSVKGGVGKSTLSACLAHGLATNIPTVLVDMDLTGTSLADVMPLCAPRWTGEVDLKRAPDGGFLDRTTTRRSIDERKDREPGKPGPPPFLNDFLLYETPDWYDEIDVHADALFWALENGSDPLRVIPSSALPRDLETILPVIFDEEHAAFLEGRLEYLLDRLLETGGLRSDRDDPAASPAATPDSNRADELAVVFDTTTTIPGLSRTVLSLALRLGGPDKQPLAQDDGFIPPALNAAEVCWTVFLVVTPDLQDLRAANRWLELVTPADQDRFRIVVNRAPQIDEAQLGSFLAGRIVGHDPLRTPMGVAMPDEDIGGLAAMQDFELIPVREQADVGFFTKEAAPPRIVELLDALRGE